MNTPSGETLKRLLRSHDLLEYDLFDGTDWYEVIHCKKCEEHFLTHEEHEEHLLGLLISEGKADAS